MATVAWPAKIGRVFIVAGDFPACPDAQGWFLKGDVHHAGAAATAHDAEADFQCASSSGSVMPASICRHTRRRSCSWLFGRLTAFGHRREIGRLPAGDCAQVSAEASWLPPRCVSLCDVKVCVICPRTGRANAQSGTAWLACGAPVGM